MTATENSGQASTCEKPSLSFDAAAGVLAAASAPLPLERVPLAEAEGRVLGQAVFARVDSPRYDAAAMDGFAVRAEEVVNGRRSFSVVGAALPGDPYTHPVGPSEAICVMTGAPIPAGCSRVLPFEWVETSANEVHLVRQPSARSHVRSRGSDMRMGMPALGEGLRLDAKRMLVAAAADHGELWVRRRPCVRIIASGDELVAPGTANISSAKVPDSLSLSLCAFARQWGAVAAEPMLLRDDPGAIGRSASAAATIPGTGLRLCPFCQ